MTSEQAIEEIKGRIDLGELIAGYGVELKRSGSGYMACCPFHHEKTPSFSINVNRGFYHCFGCGVSGDAFKFVMEREGLSFPEALKKLAAQCGVKLDERKADPEAGLRARLRALMADLAQFYHRCLLKAREAEPAREYLRQRQLSEQVAEDYLIGYAPNGVKPILTWAEKHGYTPEELSQAGVIKLPERPGDAGYHRFSGRLMFSIRDRQGRVVAFSGRQLVEKKNSGKYVNSPETPIFRKKDVLFGFDRAAAPIARSPHREFIACEGQIDTIRLQTSGFPVAVGVQGTAFTTEHARMLKRVADAAVLMFDDDGAGHKATIRVAGMLLALELPVRVVALPGGEDPDSFLLKYGAEALTELLGKAESIVAFQCRVERAKEADARSIDAVSRISHAVLSTIASCPNPVLKAGLAAEAAKLLELPAAAVQEELKRVKPAAVKAVEDLPAAAEEDFAAEELAAAGAALPGEAAAAVEPPPEREFAFMEFLLDSDTVAEVGAMLGEFLPPEVFAHDFTRGFVNAWSTATAGGADEALAAFVAGLKAEPRRWFDRILSHSGQSQASQLGPVGIMQEFVRNLWVDALKRERGRLPAVGDAAADIERMKISTDLKRLSMVKWNTVKAMVNDFRNQGRLKRSEG